MEAIKKLRTLANEIDWYVYDNGGIPYDLRKIADEMEAENAKLRELMRDTYDCICEMYRYVDGGYAYEDAEADPAYGPILKRMRELGIEVKQ